MRSSVLLTMLLFSACRSTPEPKKAAPTVLVSLQREACFGKCPLYSVRVMTDGAVTFEGERFVAVTGTSTAQLDPAALGTLVARLEASGFERWKPAYTTREVTDLATVELRFKDKTIRHYLGDAHAPAELTALEADVDTLLGTSQWVTGTGGAAQ